MRIFSPQNPNFSRKKFNINWKKLFKIFGYLCLAGFLFVAGVFLYFAKDLPNPDTIDNRVVVESTKIYDRTGDHLLYEVHGEEKRTLIPYSEMPETLRYATLSLEDQDFYSHHGIKLSSIVRAVFKDAVNMGKAQGGSTITQQLVKKTMLTDEKTLSRKVKEVILSLELEQKFSKDEILRMYLNTIPYGSNAYGVEAAAQTYFGKHAKELDLSESALIASLPQAPTYYSPYGSHPEALIARQEYALKQMKDLGYISEDQYNEAKSKNILAEIRPFQENISAPHFVMYVKEYLEKKYGDQAVEQGGLKVYTTLDWDKQQMAEQAVKAGAENNKKYKAENAALVAMDPKTGQILAMVGSKDYFDTAIDGQVNVAVRNRQPGSSFKPYVYLTAFKKGFTPETNIWDVDTNFSTDTGKDYNPKNYDDKNRGLIQMKDALALSLNVPAVETLYLAGVKDSIDTAHQMGINTLTDPKRYGLSLVLGGGEVTLLEHTNAFSTFATGGIHHDKTAILKVQDNAGKTLEEYKPSDGQRVVDEKYVSMMDYIMSTNDLRAPVFGENNPLNFNGRPVAAKTGTTNEWRDGWTMGYTTSLAVGVWAGNNDNSTMAQGADGIFVAAPIFRSFMDQALKNSNLEKFPEYKPEETGKDILDGKANQELKVCKIDNNDYCLASPACSSKDIKTKKYTITHSILYYINKDDPQGDAPKNPEADPQYKNWEKAVSKWIDDHKDDYSDKEPPKDECKASDFGDSGSTKLRAYISKPNDGDTITTSSFSIKVSASGKRDIDKITLFIEGSQVAEESGSSLDYTYEIPDDKKNSNISIKATAMDTSGDKDSESISVKTNVQ